MTKEDLQAKLAELQAAQEKQQEQLGILEYEVDEFITEDPVARVKGALEKAAGHGGWHGGVKQVQAEDWGELILAIGGLPDESALLKAGNELYEQLAAFQGTHSSAWTACQGDAIQDSLVAWRKARE